MKEQSFHHGFVKSAKHILSKPKRALRPDRQASKAPNLEREAQGASQPWANTDTMAKHSGQAKEGTPNAKKCIFVRAAKKVKHAASEVVEFIDDFILIPIINALGMAFIIYFLITEGLD